MWKLRQADDHDNSEDTTVCLSPIFILEDKDWI